MEKNVEKTFFLLGSKENPYPYIKKADYFFIFSLKENSSNVLSEAMILNKKILITDTETKYLIKDYPNAKVFENSESGIYNGLRYILSSRKYF